MNNSSLLTFFILVVSISPIYGSTSVSQSIAASKKRLNDDTVSPFLKRMEYAVRGCVVIAADKINDQLQKSSGNFPFDHIVYTNIGNPQSGTYQKIIHHYCFHSFFVLTNDFVTFFLFKVGQRPLTWPRQVLALVDLPDENGVNHPDALKLFPADAIQRAREIKQGLGGSSGSYSHSKGARLFREDVAQFIEQRDGVPADPEDIYLSNGASAAIEHVLKALIADSNW